MTTILGVLLALMLPLATPEPYQKPPLEDASNSVNRASSMPAKDQRGQAPEGRRKRRHRKHKAPRSPRVSSSRGMAA
jgi:hypothetical protein